MVPMMYFHYGAKEHIDRFFEDGSIQIGTLRAYDEAEFGTKIGDDQEGRSYEALHDGNYEEFRRRGGQLPTGFGGLPMFDNPGSRGNLFVRTNQSFNYAIFCMSHILHQRLCTDFSERYDAAIIIDRPFVFIHELTLALQQSQQVPIAVLQHVADVHYGSRDVPFGTGDEIVEVLLKDRSYAHQCETRAIWNVGPPEQRFFRFKAPLARRSCRQISLSDMPSYEAGCPPEQAEAEFFAALHKSVAGPDSSVYVGADPIVGSR